MLALGTLVVFGAAILASRSPDVEAKLEGATASSCDDTKISKASGGYWTCTFEDNFDGTTLDRGMWTPMDASVGFSTAGECFVDDPAHISVADGLLTLRATKLPEAAQCGPISSQFQTAMIFTEEKFAQTYGRFEARLKFPPGSGFTSAFWLWPEDKAYGEKSGEIDVAEYFGAYPDLVSPHIHIKEGAGGDRGAGAFCRIVYATGAFHTYTVEWSPEGFTFLYDGVPCMTLGSWDPGSPLTFPQPFDQRFFILLSIAPGYNENAITDSSPFPAELKVDYVRAWA